MQPHGGADIWPLQEHTNINTFTLMIFPRFFLKNDDFILVKLQLS